MVVAHDDAPHSEGQRAGPRKIALFSDGTGNSSGKLFKTNVWRLYEALDLGPANRDRHEQIALYSNGVGTSTFRPLAMLGGVFGIGLKANVLELYKYICRNWRPGDEIYLFGFSRGAFTIRLLTGLLASQGILRGETPDLPPDEDQLAYRARAAYRAFAGETWPNRRLARTASWVVRGARNGVLRLQRRLTRRAPYDPSRNRMTDIAFVGVWDTVAAYGGPIVEITRGVDNWIWPLTMPDYGLSPSVAKARHALALDDERDAFQPLLWDEVREEMLVRRGGPVRRNAHPVEPGIVREVRQVAEGRLKQVWFAGMHADVGGGYPDESLSFVSLLWMIDELDGALAILPEHLRRISSMANVFGPLHNSRSGLGSYYRYQPRRIVAMLEPADASDEPDPIDLFAATRSMRDPEIADHGYELPDTGQEPDERINALAERIRSDHGLLTSVRVHESVLSRVLSGTDSYAPVSLPRRFDVVFATRTGRSDRVLDAVAARNLRKERRSGRSWFDRQTAIWDMVWCRRLQYFALAACSLLLVSMPLWDGASERIGVPRLCIDDRCAVQPVLEIANLVTGGYAQPWVHAFAAELLATILLSTAIVLLFAYGSAYELRLRGRARHAWQVALKVRDGSGDRPAPRGIAAIRDRPGYQALMRTVKWRVAPFVAGAGLLAGGLYGLAALVFQLGVLPMQERRAAFCADTAPGHATIEGAVRPTVPMDVATICTSTGHAVADGQTYSVRITMLPGPPGTTGWQDDHAPATPAYGEGADLRWWADLAGIPFRRVVLAGWMQPLASIRPAAEPDESRWRRLVGRPVAITRLRLACDPVSGGYTGRFRAAQPGNLSLFVNDAMLPLDTSAGRLRLAPVGGLYRNNRGKAVVQVWRFDAEPPPPVRPERAVRCLPPTD